MVTENLVFRSEKGTPVTNSLLVAEKFGKEHKDVLEAVRNLTAENSAVKNMYYETTYVSGRNRAYPIFVMNRDGFSLLVMGFTGKEALKFKLDYIEAFNKMEEVIRTAGFQIPQTYSEALMIAAKQAEQIERQEKQLLIQAPKAKYYDDVLSSDNLMPISVIAQNYGMTGEALNEILCFLKVQYKKGRHWIITVKYKGRDYTRIVPEIRELKDGKRIVVNQMKWTESGRKFIHDLLVEKGLINRQKCLAI